MALKTPLPERIIFFDGVCNLCNETVDFLLPKRKRKSIYFASFQGETAQELLGSLAQDMKSFIYWDNGKIYTESDAYFKILGCLAFPWRMLKVFRIIPSWLCNIVYRWIGRNRYRWFGKRDTCRLPTPEEREFFLD